ncbi:MAG: hypothetical protein Q9213_004944 [Squamulea squamosa]
MEKDPSLSYNDEVIQQFEREGVEVYSPHRHYDHSHPFLPEKASGDEDPLDLTLAPKAPVLTSTETESVNTLNRACFPSQGLQQPKRKRSDTTEYAAEEPPKKSKIASANSGVAIDAFKASSQISGGKLKRPSPKLISGQAGIPLIRSDPFETGPDPQEKPSLPKQNPTGARRGRPPKITEHSTRSAALPQVCVTDRPGVPATSAEIPSKAGVGRPPSSNNEKGAKRPNTGHQLHSRIEDSGAETSQQPERRQLRSQKLEAAKLGRLDPCPSTHREVSRSPSTDQDGNNLQSQYSSGDGALSKDRSCLRPQSDGSSVEAKHNMPDSYGPKLLQRVLGNNRNESEAFADPQASLLESTTNDDKGGNHTSHGNAADDQEYEYEGEESREHESEEQENDSEENQEIGSQVSEQRDAQNSRTARNNLKPELLGTDDMWKRINDARREVGVSNIRGHKVREVPLLKSERGIKVVDRIKAAVQIFASTDDSQPDVHRKIIRNLTRCVANLSESSCQDKESEVIQDIYAHAVPTMVELLDKAFNARRIQLSDRNNITCIGEIIQLQDALATLCEKARAWTAKPETSRPIIQPTVTINSIVRRMRTVFSKELDDRKRRLKMQAAKANHPPEFDEVTRQRELDEARRRNGRRRQMIIDACLRGCETEWRERPTSRPQIQKPDPLPATARLSTPQHVVEGWSREQDEAFLVEIQKSELRDLPAEEFCLEVLNAPLLQNKLPEHIRERARYFKAAIEANLSPKILMVRSIDTCRIQNLAADMEKGIQPAAAPAKRLAGSTIKPSTPIPTSATKPTMASVSRSTPTGGPAKDPSGYTVRSRPQSTALSSVTPIAAHKSKASLSSAAGSSKGALVMSSGGNRGGENTPLTQNAKSRSISPIKPIPKATVKQSTPRRPSTVKPTVTRSTQRTSNVVLPSPVPNPISTPSTRSSPPPAKTRPGIGPRKSTMSVTIQQRLREMSLVHEMLRAAMAEDGDESDDLKDEYGKQADDSLAALKARLEEAKTLEGSFIAEKPSTNETSSNADQFHTSDAGQPISRLEDHDRSSAAQPLDGLSTTANESTDKAKDVHSGRRSIDTIEGLRADLERSYQAKSSLKHEVQQLEVSKQHLVDRHQKTIDSLEQQIRQHEVKRSEAAEQHSGIVSALRLELQEMANSKDREINHLGAALEGLQTTVQELTEAKEREIDALKDSLAIEHEDVVAKFKSQLDEVRATLAFLHASNTELRQTSDDYKKEIFELNFALDASKAHVARLSEENAEGLKQIQDLYDTNETMHTALKSVEENLKQKSEDAARLYRQLKASEAEYQSTIDKALQIEEELARLHDEFKSSQRLAEDDRSELIRIQSANESLIEQLAEQKPAVTNFQQRVDTLGQELHDKDASLRELQTQLETLRTEHESITKRDDVIISPDVTAKLEELTTQLHKAQAMVEQKATRIRELESASKVIKAELIELKTNRSDGSSNSGSPTRKLDLRSSLWPKKDGSINGTGGESGELVAGEDLSSHVQGQLAGMQARLRQMGDMNEELIERDKKLVRKMDRVLSPSRTQSPKPLALMYRHVKASPDALHGHDQVLFPAYEGEEPSL